MISAISPWFGSNRMLGPEVGKALRGCEWVGVPFCGGMCELPHIGARTMLVSDLHRHVINLARTIQHQREPLQDYLRGLAFHPDELAGCQETCRLIEDNPSKMPDAQGDFAWAACYFVTAWMARSSTAGTDGEFRAGLATRWNASGGDSAVRYQGAVEALAEWEKIMRRCTFVCLDVFDFLTKVKDEAGHGLYLDPPFPGPGDKYRHKFGEDKHRQLAAKLAEFEVCRVVCRFYDVPLVHFLYPEPSWKWHRLDGGRKQTNEKVQEVLIVRN